MKEGQTKKERKRKKKRMKKRKKKKVNKTRNQLKVSDSKTYWLKTEERTKNGEKSSRNHPRKRFGRVTEAP